MREEARIDRTMDLMKKLWHLEQYKDLRFWQLVTILELHAKCLLEVDDVWNVEEDKWEQIIESLIAK